MNGASEIFWRSSLQNTKINTKVKTNLNLKKNAITYLFSTTTSKTIKTLSKFICLS